MADDRTLLAEIVGLEEMLHRPENRRSRDKLEALLAPGFTEIGASGTFYCRDTIIEQLLREDEGGNDGTLHASDYALTKISQEVILLTYRTHRVHADGSERTARRSSIWKYEGGTWRLLFHQGTLTSPK